jgi:hypothetical protein
MGLTRSPEWRILAPLLVLTVLACYGVCGGLHQSVPTSVLVGEHPPHAGNFAGQTGGTHDEVPLGGANYAATLFSFLAAVFWLLFGGKLARVGAGQITWPARNRHRLVVFGYPRGPTLPLLQVLRL